MERASLEDDDELTERWAALLASAAGEPTAVPPSFPVILSELSAIEARMLQLAVDQIEEDSASVRGVEADEFQGRLGISPHDYAVNADNLVRLGLVYGRPFVVSAFAGEVSLMTESRAVLILSSLGLAFMHACTPPA